MEPAESSCTVRDGDGGEVEQGVESSHLEAVRHPGGCTPESRPQRYPEGCTPEGRIPGGSGDGIPRRSPPWRKSGHGRANGTPGQAGRRPREEGTPTPKRAGGAAGSASDAPGAGKKVIGFEKTVSVGGQELANGAGGSESSSALDSHWLTGSHWLSLALIGQAKLHPLAHRCRLCGFGATDPQLSRVEEAWSQLAPHLDGDVAAWVRPLVNALGDGTSVSDLGSDWLKQFVLIRLLRLLGEVGMSKEALVVVEREFSRAFDKLVSSNPKALLPLQLLLELVPVILDRTMTSIPRKPRSLLGFVMVVLLTSLMRSPSLQRLLGHVAVKVREETESLRSWAKKVLPEVLTPTKEECELDSAAARVDASSALVAATAAEQGPRIALASTATAGGPQTLGGLTADGLTAMAAPVVVPAECAVLGVAAAAPGVVTGLLVSQGYRKTRAALLVEEEGTVRRWRQRLGRGSCVEVVSREPGGAEGRRGGRRWVMAVISGVYGEGERRVLSLRYGEKGFVKLLQADSPTLRPAGFEGAVLEAFNLEQDEDGGGEEGGTAAEEVVGAPPESRRRWVKGATAEVFCPALGGERSGQQQGASWLRGEVTQVVVNPGSGASSRCPVRVRVEVKRPGRGTQKLWRAGDSSELRFVDAAARREVEPTTNIPRSPGQGAAELMVAGPGGEAARPSSGGDDAPPAPCTAPACGDQLVDVVAQHLPATPQRQRPRRVLGSVLGGAFSPAAPQQPAAEDSPKATRDATDGATSAGDVDVTSQLPGRLSSAFSLCLSFTP